MRITYRFQNNQNYWEERWKEVQADKAMKNSDVYPLLYAEKVISGDKKGEILEAGCGAGRIIRYYQDRGFNIYGFDFIPSVIKELKMKDRKLKVQVGNITNLNYDDNSFKYILSFGLYHNLEKDLDKAISESYRILKNGGSLCASFRADNIQTRISDFLAYQKIKKRNSNKKKKFHKCNLTKKEFITLLNNHGFNVQSIYSVQNMPFLYKFKIFRDERHQSFNESLGRSEGYKLSLFGSFIQNLLIFLFPNQFCNLYVIIASKGNQ